MAHESFEDEEVARLLNRDFVSIKVDKEERPDIDGVYMRACQAMTGSGGWPTSVFMTAEGRPFYAGTYFPKQSFKNLLVSIADIWKQDRTRLIESGDRISEAISEKVKRWNEYGKPPIDEALEGFRRSFDREYGGFGSSPKFPSPHNLMFLLRTAPGMAEKTLEQMYRGGIFDHIGGGFSRYSTDRKWLVPHFEKMLYDNAMLSMAYLMAYEETGKEIYRKVAARVFEYLELELRSKEGGFFSAQDADSDGVEGKYYVFTPDEIIKLLGPEDGKRFCQYYGITEKGNFEGKSIPNLLSTDIGEWGAELLPKVYDYRRSRTALRTDGKQLTAWNSLAAAAYAMAARILGEERYRRLAETTLGFIERELIEGNTVYVSQTAGVRSGKGFLDDYAYYIFALIQMHQATLEDKYLNRAEELAREAVRLFWDDKDGGFFFSGEENEMLFLRPKESWDGALPSGNSVMSYNLSRLSLLTGDAEIEKLSAKQDGFMRGEAAAYPTGYGFYLYSALPVKSIVCSVKARDDLNGIKIRSDWAFRLTQSSEYPLLNGTTTYYVCENGVCQPPSNELNV
jgi:uncharacterized protein YyaL (SSP411 family)